MSFSALAGAVSSWLRQISLVVAEIAPIRRDFEASRGYALSTAGRRKFSPEELSWNVAGIPEVFRPLRMR
jgi:hypothetical protein